MAIGMTRPGRDGPSITMTGTRMCGSSRVHGRGFEEFDVRPEATLFDVMAETARLSGVGLLPPGEHPFDRLHSLHGDVEGPVIENLHQTVEHYLRNHGSEPRFAVELKPTFRVTTRWAVAPKEELTPREVLELPQINLPYQDYTLYPPDSTVPLPLDKPVRIERGMDFEAQRDGKYGSAT